MRFTFAEAMTDPSFYIPLAKAAEAAGYHAMTIPDSVLAVGRAGAGTNNIPVKVLSARGTPSNSGCSAGCSTRRT